MTRIIWEVRVEGTPYLSLLHESSVTGFMMSTSIEWAYISVVQRRVNV